MALRSTLFAVTLFAGAGGAASAQTPAPSAGPGQRPAAPTPATATIDQVAWIAGAWSGKLNDRIIEQHWMTPLGGSMVAMYRSIRDNKPTLYELLAIETEGSGLALRIKHFAPGVGLVSQEAKEESANHTLVRVEDRKAVFEAATATGPVRVTFTSPDPATLTIVVERQRDGKPVSTDFNYKRVAR
jgi:hypothetical protein